MAPTQQQRLTKAQTDRAAGVLLGQAAGDALGVPYEFGTPPTGEAQMLGGGLGDYTPGEYSDDTQMAVVIARVAATGADLTTDQALDTIADGFIAWQQGGPADIGVQTSSVLRGAQPGPGSAARLRQRAHDMVASGRRAGGNGALMRTGVVGISSLHDRERTAAAARAIAELTHADPDALDSCVLWSEAVRVAVLEGRLDVESGLDLLPPARRALWASRLAAAERGERDRSASNGWTVAALQDAWTAIRRTPGPEESATTSPCDHLQAALHAAVRSGNDTDTVAAIAGALLGARWGGSAVPARWRRRLHGIGDVRTRDLVRLAVLTARGWRGDDKGWPLAAHVTYSWVPQDDGVPHPSDPGVVLGTTGTALGRAARSGAFGAVVSLCRRGTDDVVAGVAPSEQVDVWLMDSDLPEDNPNLAFVLRDTAAVIAELRDEGHAVLVHCVAAQQRTPSVAVAYAAHRGVDPRAAAGAVQRALGTTRGSGHLCDAAQGQPRPER